MTAGQTVGDGGWVGDARAARAPVAPRIPQSPHLRQRRDADRDRGARKQGGAGQAAVGGARVFARRHAGAAERRLGWGGRPGKRGSRAGVGRVRARAGE